MTQGQFNALAGVSENGVEKRNGDVNDLGFAVIEGAKT